MSDKTIESIQLFFKVEPSDKVYNATLLETSKGHTLRQQLMSPRLMKHLLIIISVASLVGTVKAAPTNSKMSAILPTLSACKTGSSTGLMLAKTMHSTGVYYISAWRTPNVWQHCR